MSATYEKAKALCPDGKVRTVCYQSKLSDHYFFPKAAHTRSCGKYVGGYLVSVTEKDLPKSMLPRSGMRFVPHAQYKGRIENTICTTLSMWRWKEYPAHSFMRTRWIWE